MKKLISITLLAFLLLSCGGKTEKKQTAIEVDNSIVNVYYFHGKQRCKTCLAIEEVAKNTIAENYKDNAKVKFVEVNIEDEKDKALTEKYEIAFSSLLIAKGENFVDITDKAFDNAVNSPDELSKIIIEEVNKRIEE